MEHALIETEILVGDVVELRPTRMSTIDDLDLEKCTVLEVDKLNGRIKVVFNKDNSTNEIFFSTDSTVDWFSTEHVIDIERDHKVLDLTDTQDTITRQEACLITMARVIKQAIKTSQGYNIVPIPDDSMKEIFILIGFAAHELEELTGTTNRVSFAQFKPRYTEIDHVPTKVWQPKKPINEPYDIFTISNVS